MPPSIELNIGHVPGPRRIREEGEETADAPLRIVVLGNFSGTRTGARPPLAHRRPNRIDIDTFDAVFTRLAPSVGIAGMHDGLGVETRIPLATMDDFGADAVLARLPAQALAERAAATASVPSQPPARDVAPAADVAAQVDTEDAAATLRRLLGGSVAEDAPARAPSPALARTSAEKTDGVVDRFIRQLVGGSSSGVEAVVSTPPPGADAAAAALLRHVLRDPAWRHLECAWRSVDRFVRQLEMDDGSVRLELLDCAADEVLADLAAVGGDPARSALAPALKGDGRGCALLVSLEEFGPGITEMSLLGGLAALASAHGAVLLAGAAPTLVAVAASQDAATLATPEARVWHALRRSALAPAIGMTFPRLLARLPYGPRNDPVAAFAFDELADSPAAPVHDLLLWRSAALDAALLLAQGHAGQGVEAIVRLEDLPAFIDRSGDEPRLQAVAEAYLGEGEAHALQAAGFLVLQSDRRVPEARVSGWRSIAADGAALAGAWRPD